MSEKVQTYTELASRVSAFQNARAKAASNNAGGDTEAVHGIKDPQEKGTPPGGPRGSDRPEESAAAQNLPANAVNDGTTAGNFETKELGAGSNKKSPTPISGDAKDQAATSPTTPLPTMDPANKSATIAQRAQTIAARIQGLSKTAQNTSQSQSHSTNESAATDFNLGSEFLMKLACSILESEDGIKYAQEILTKKAGQEAAQELISGALNEQNEWVKYASAEEEAQYAYAQQLQQAQEAEQYIGELLKSASEEDLRAMDTMSNLHDTNLSQIQNEVEKAAYMQGADDAAAMMDAEEAGGEAMIPGAEEGEASPEEIIALLDAAVASGEIDEETALAAVEALVGAEGGEAMDPALMEEDIEKMASHTRNLAASLTA